MPVALTSFEEAAGRARALTESGGRQLLGIAGMPGAGKSLLAERLCEALGRLAVCVPLDGFHLANEVLARTGRRARKGAPDTFDAAGYVALLRRLRAAPDGVTVYAPRFRREIEEPIAGAVAVPASVPLVITEGNYLLLEEPDWNAVRPLLAEAWYLEVPEKVRIARLIERHRLYGRSENDARKWALGSDQANADRIAPTRARADVVLRL
jgi:pantothenate kinase